MKHILLPIDFSLYSITAFKWACYLASKLHARIEMVHVNTDAGHVRPEPILQVCAEAVDIEYTVIHGSDIVESLLKALKEKEYLMVVMGTHGRTGVKRIVLGSIAEKMVRLSPVPVMSVHSGLEVQEISNILLPIDFSKCARNAMKYAAQMCEKIGAKLHVVHIVEPQVYPTLFPEGIYPETRFTPETMETVKSELERFVRPFSRFVATQRVFSGNAAEKILETAETSGAELVLMGTRGLSGLEHLLIGSTAEQVVRMAGIPVLTVRRLPVGQKASAMAWMPVMPL